MIGDEVSLAAGRRVLADRTEIGEKFGDVQGLFRQGDDLRQERAAAAIEMRPQFLDGGGAGGAGGDQVVEVLSAKSFRFISMS